MEKDNITQGLLAKEHNSGNGYLSSSDFSSGQTQIALRKASRQVISLSTCSKACVISFAVGVVIGFTLKRRMRRWAAKILKRFTDD